MQCLLDTHALIWLMEGDARLSARARRFIEQSSSNTFVSIASFYEIAIKMNIGKLSLTRTLQQFYEEAKLNGLQILPIRESHLSQLVQLPQVPGHRDPFDRLLIATAIAEEMTVLTADPLFQLYSSSIQVIW